ncbi:hypothetical protein MSAN_00003300 [Mycena sanguinolenta]|uniref:DUF6533 domain-containing protein n=1 Tax=Mycena sanguinolenta TaxID=230812 RepID=A0A8H6ZEJ8_9AGAR|nr:hypothetical protein MSAN_00003300 [Mycena sanguinolenta]
MIPAAPHLRGAQRDGRPLALPKYYPPEDKYHKRPEQTWVKIPISVFGLFRFHLVLPNIKSVHGNAVSRFGRMRGVLVLLISFLALCFMVFAFVKRFGSTQKKWPGGDSPTLVFKREDLGKIWRWEVASGHHPSRRSIPQKLGLNSLPDNPALPPKFSTPSRFKTTTNGVGSRRTYLDIQSKPPSVAYPPRPVPGSIADFDIITHHCDFGEGKFVRDCLEVLRVGGGLDNGNRIRRGRFDDWKYIYVEESTPAPVSLTGSISQPKGIIRSEHEAYLDEGFTKSRHAAWEPPLTLPPPEQYIPHSVKQSCEDDPRLFHMYWTGPFTDKPYLAVLSFLFTQNTGLHLAGEEGIDSYDEVKFMWRKPWTRTKFIYFFIRYIPLCIQISTLLIASPELTPQFHFTPHDCFIWEVYQGVGTVLVFGAVDYVLILRVYALYHNNPTVHRVVFVAFASEVCGMCVGLGLSLGKIKFDDICLTTAVPGTLTVYGGSTLLFQTFLFILTVIKFITAVREGWGDTPLVGLIMRDGTWAFFLLFAVVAANSALFALKNHDLASILFGWILSVFSFSGYHVLLNLAYRLHDDGPRLATIQSSTYESPYPFDARIVTDRDRAHELSTFRAEAGSSASAG